MLTSFERILYFWVHNVTVFISMILTRSTNYQQGKVETFKLSHFINLPLFVCLAWVLGLQIVSRSRSKKLQALAIQGTQYLFKKYRAFNFFFFFCGYEICLGNKTFLLCIGEHFFTTSTRVVYCICNGSGASCYDLGIDKLKRGLLERLLSLLFYLRSLLLLKNAFQTTWRELQCLKVL